MTMTVVILDDVAASLTSMRLLVERIGGCRVEPFSDPARCLEWSAGHPVDLVLLDHFMPGMSGLEFLNRFRALPGRAEVPVVMVTSSEDRTVRYDALRAGATDFLTKPADFVELTARIGNMLALRRSQQELAERARRLEAASRAKSAFLANMSHELRTPLNAIIGYCDILIEDAQDLNQPSLFEDLGKIRGAGKHLLGLINEILDLSKIEAGKMELSVEAFDVAAVVADVQVVVQPLAAKAGNRLEISCPRDLGRMVSDPMKLRQNLLNLLSNSCKFTEAGLVRLEVARDGDWLRFAVSDTGIGMTEEQLSRLFGAFEQGDSSTTRRFGGTGLGLAITRHFCQMLGGSIAVTSAPGQGACFIMRLPAQCPAQAAPPDSQAAGPDPQAVAERMGPADMMETLT